MWWGPGDGWGWLFGGLFMLGFWVLVILLVVWAVRGFRPVQGREERRESNAMAILEERFARGEIDREEFEQRRAVLQGR